MKQDLDALKAALANWVRSLFPRIDYLARYEAKVIAQNADGTLELVPDDARLPGLSNVPIRYGVPGVKATVAPGARVLLGFAGSDPAKPQAELWDTASVTKLTVSATLVELAGAVEAALKGTSYANAESTFLSALGTYATAIKGVADPANTATPTLLTAIGTFQAAASAALSAKVKVG